MKLISSEKITNEETFEPILRLTLDIPIGRLRDIKILMSPLNINSENEIINILGAELYYIIKGIE